MSNTYDACACAATSPATPAGRLPISFSLQELAATTGGRLSGPAETRISGAAPLETAGPGDITFVDSKKLAPKLKETAAAAVVLPADWASPEIPAIHVPHVQAVFRQIFAAFHPPRQQPRIGVSAAAFVCPTAKLGSNVDVYPGASVGSEVEIGDNCEIHAGVHVMAGCRIGAGTRIYPGAVLYPETQVGERVIIHANAVLGANGFGYEMIDGSHQLGPQFGNVVIEDDVEIGAAATIDRGAYGPTVVGQGSKLDNQVMVAHNCRIGKHNLLCSQVGIAGTVTTGDYVVMGGQAGVRDHVTIGSQTMLGAKSGVMNNVPPKSLYAGIPATPIKVQKLQQAALAKLPELRKTIRDLQKSAQSGAAVGSSTAAEKPAPPESSQSSDNQLSAA